MMKRQAPRISTAQEPQAAEFKPKLAILPPFRVILHNDHVNTFEHVVATLRELAGLSSCEAFLRTLEAHLTGCALVVVTHLERAELYVEQFHSKSLTATMESA